MVLLEGIDMADDGTSKPRLVDDYDRDYTNQYIGKYRACSNDIRLEIYVYSGRI